MDNKYEFFIAGRARNKYNILKICDLFDKYNISYYCFLKNENDWGYGEKGQTPEEKQKEFESLDLKSDIVLNLYNNDLNGLKNSNNLLLVLPAGNAAHIESGIAFGLNKKCYAIGDYEATDTLYNIFDEIFKDEEEFEKFISKYDMDSDILLLNIDKIHTTLLGEERIRKNINIDNNNVVDYLKSKIVSKKCKRYKKGKNWYCEIDNIIITINSCSYTIITAHLTK